MEYIHILIMEIIEYKTVTLARNAETGSVSSGITRKMLLKIDLTSYQIMKQMSFL